jgi:hypothetical protein
MIAAEDEELLDWLYGVSNSRPTEAGGFLRTIVEAAQRADSENYPLLRPVLVQLKSKYPTYTYAGEEQ